MTVHVMCLQLIVDLTKSNSGRQMLVRIPEYEISWEPIQQQQSCSVRTRTDGRNEIKSLSPIFAIVLEPIGFLKFCDRV
jgi:hypothetical protein